MAWVCCSWHCNFSLPSWLDFPAWSPACLITTDLSGHLWAVSWILTLKPFSAVFFQVLWDCTLREGALPCHPGCHPWLLACPPLQSSLLCSLTKPFRVRNPPLVLWNRRCFACTCSSILNPSICSSTQMLHPPLEAWALKYKAWDRCTKPFIILPAVTGRHQAGIPDPTHVQVSDSHIYLISTIWAPGCM